MRLFITGNAGQLGRTLAARLGEHTVAGGDLPDWDMTDSAQVEQTLADFAPDVVIHTAALTAVDYCAQHPAEAVRINAVGTYNIANACRQIGARLLHISTNEVFDGTASRPYQEYDHRNPINPYGYSKYVAERVVERLVPSAMIVRTAWLYTDGGNNFIHKVLAKARAGETLRIVTDEVGNPTYVPDLADGVAALIEQDRPGIYHFVNEGAATRFQFAQAAVELAGLHAPLEPITSDSFERPSTPPPYAPMANVFGAAAGVRLRPWREALAAFLAGQTATA